MTKTEAIDAAVTAAEKMSVVGWGVFGCLIAIVTIPVAYLRSPAVPALVLAEHNDDATLRYFEAQYIETLKKRQVKSAWAGGILCCVAAILLSALINSAQRGW